MRKKPIIRLYFVDMWGHGPYIFNLHDNYFVDLFSLQYTVIIDNINPDILIYSCFGLEHLKYTCFKIFFSGENIPNKNNKIKINPDYSECQISFSKYPTRERNYYFPLWVLFVNWFSKFQPRPLPSNPTYSVPICSLLNSAASRSLPGFGERRSVLFINNNFIKNRVMLFLDLERLVDVHSFGSLFNNSQHGPLRGTELDKQRLMLDYRFTISMENSYYYGYNTEKIIQPYAAGSVPIYSGGLDLTTFNKRALILEEDFHSRQDMIGFILSINSSKDFWEEILNQPLFVENKIPERYHPRNILSWIQSHL